MYTCTAEAVDVVFPKSATLLVEGFGIGCAILLDDVEFEDRPRPDFIEADSGVGHAAHRQATVRWETRRFLGNWFHSWPSRRRPPLFGERPPHCLKKKATPAARHWSRISQTHSGRIGRAPGPLSPPTITQLISRKSSVPTGAISGSIERKRTPALALCRCAI